MRGLFIRPLGACNIAPFEFKRNPALVGAIMAGAAAAGSIGSAAINAGVSTNLNQANRDYDWRKTQYQNEYNSEQAEIARQHQLGMLSKEQEWQEYMYNQYSSPSALRRQYEEAGYNPYLVDGNGSVGQSFASSPSAPSGAQASAGNNGNPTTFMPDLSGFGRGISDAANMFISAQSAQANIANTSAKTLNEVAEAFNKLVESGMSEKDAQILTEPFLKGTQGLNTDSNMFYEGMSLANQGKKISNEFNALQLSIEKEFGRTERADKVMNMEQQFSVMAADIGRMAVQNKLDEASIDKVASEIARNFSEVGLNQANAQLIRDSMIHFVHQAEYEARSAWFEQAGRERSYNLDTPTYEARMSELGQKVEVVDYYTDKVVDKASKLMKVNIGFSNGKYNSKTYFESQNKNWNVRSNFDYKHGITAP